MSAGQPARALFATSNGFGLGHVTRCMAIARRLPDDVQPIIFTLSEALPIVRDEGFFAEYFSSRDAENETSAQWNGRLAQRIGDLLEAYRPTAVVFDGTYPYAGMLHALRHSGTRRIWCRRGMWRAGEGRANLMFEPEFDAVLQPGEAAGDVDSGVTTRSSGRVTRVPPILLRDTEEVLSREEAAERAGVAADRINVLMQPGWENEVFGPSAALCIERLSRDPRVHVVVAVSPLRSRAVPLPDGVAKVSTYPLASVYRAFDFSISGAGYNIYHELLASGCRGCSCLTPALRWTTRSGVRASPSAPGSPQLGVPERGRPRPPPDRTARRRRACRDGPARARAPLRERRRSGRGAGGADGARGRLVAARSRVRPCG